LGTFFWYFSADAILAQAERIARGRPGFTPRDEWLQAMRLRMRADRRAP
jgi:hypothetical protein